MPLRSPTLNVSAPPSASVSISSMPSRSMSIAPTSRRRRTPRPSRVSSNRSASALPRKNSESCPPRPTTWSFPSPGFQLERLLSPPRSTKSSPLFGVTSSNSSPPSSTSSPLPPKMTSPPSPPSSVSRTPPAGSDEPLSWSSPARPSTRSASPGPASSIWTKTGQPEHGHRPAGEREEVDEVAVRRARQARPAEGAVQLLQRREREVADVHAAGPAGRGEVEALDPVELDRDAAVGAGAAARGGDVEVLAGLRGRVRQPVLAAAAVDDDPVDGAAPGSRSRPSRRRRGRRSARPR